MRKFSSTTKGSSRRTFHHNPLVLLVVAGVCVVALVVFAPRVVSFAASIVLTPLVRIEHWVGESSGALPSFLRSRTALLEEESRLRQELAEHAGAALHASRLAVENDELRALIGATTPARIAAGVVGRPGMLPYDVFLIDRGAEDGVVERAPVYVGDDRVIGFVARVYNKTALVALATTPQFESTVYIYGPNIYTTAVGQGGGTLRVNVPQGIVLSEGDLVVMPALHGGVYGEISVVDSVPSRPEQYGYVSIETPLAGVRVVGVGQVPLEEMSFEEARTVVESVRNDMLTVDVPQGVLVDVNTATSTATTTATTTESGVPLEQ